MSTAEGGEGVYRFCRDALGLLLRLWCRACFTGAENVPREGACILVANHVSYLDPPMVGCGVQHRLIRFVARDTLLTAPIVGWFIRRLQCIPINRNSGDIAAMRSVLRTLRDGGAVALFPEGTRSPNGRMREAKRGIGFIVAKAGVPVVPVHVSGTYKAFPKGASWIRPHKVGTVFGAPIEMSEMTGGGRADYAEIGRVIMQHIAELAPASDV